MKPTKTIKTWAIWLNENDGWWLADGLPIIFQTRAEARRVCSHSCYFDDRVRRVRITIEDKGR